MGLVESEFQNHVLLKAVMHLNDFVINSAFRSDGLRTVLIGAMSCELTGKHAVVGAGNKQSDCGFFFFFVVVTSGFVKLCKICLLWRK